MASYLLTILLDDYAEPLALRKNYFHTYFLVERLDILEVPVSWICGPPVGKSVHILTFPCLFPPNSIAQYFRAINHATMLKSYEDTLLSGRVLETMHYRDRVSNMGMHRDPNARLDATIDKFLVFEVSRENILTDALNQLWRRQKRELHKPLKVRLGVHEGEEGVDHGGVQQEFFRLAIAEAFRPDYGVSWSDSGLLYD